jgi:hypothetical protein
MTRTSFETYYYLFYTTMSYKKSSHVGIREILLRLVPQISGASEECHEERRVVQYMRPNAKWIEH